MTFRCIRSNKQTKPTPAQPNLAELTTPAELIYCLTWELPWCPHAQARPKTLVWAVLGFSPSLQCAETQRLTEQNGLIVKFHRALPSTNLRLLLQTEGIHFYTPSKSFNKSGGMNLGPGAYSWGIQELHLEKKSKTWARSVPLCDCKLRKNYIYSRTVHIVNASFRWLFHTGTLFSHLQAYQKRKMSRLTFCSVKLS